MGCASSREGDPSVQPSRPTSSPETRTGNTPSALAQAQSMSTQPRQLAGSRRDNSVAAPQRSGTNRSRRDTDVPIAETTTTPLQSLKPWRSTSRTWTRTQLRREREDFFSTQVTGHKEIWDAIRQITEFLRQGNLADAQGIMTAVGLTSPTGQLEEGAYDERGVLYRLPQEVVSDPLNVLDDDNETVVGDDILQRKLDIEAAEASNEDLVAEKGDKGKEMLEDTLKVRCRLSDRGGQDFNVVIAESAPVGLLVRRLRLEATIASSAKVRIAYMGRIMVEGKTLQEQNWVPGHVVQVLVSNPAPP